jgi:hypothetical protein
MPALAGSHRVYFSGLAGYPAFRIPVLLPAGRSLLAFAEARQSAETDDGRICLVLRRSEDEGQTWGAVEPLFDVSTSWSGVPRRTLTMGNPVPIYDPTRRRLVLLFCTSGTSEHVIRAGQARHSLSRRVWLTFSSDLARSWSTPTEITAQVKGRNWVRAAAPLPSLSGDLYPLELSSGSRALPAHLLSRRSHTRACTDVVCPWAGWGDLASERDAAGACESCISPRSSPRHPRQYSQLWYANARCDCAAHAPYPAP